MPKKQGLDDLGKIAEKVVKSVTKGKKTAKKVVRKAANDIPDPKYKKNPYNSKGGLKKDYKDYVLRNNKGEY